MLWNSYELYIFEFLRHELMLVRNTWRLRSHYQQLHEFVRHMAMATLTCVKTAVFRVCCAASYCVWSKNSSFSWYYRETTYSYKFVTLSSNPRHCIPLSPNHWHLRCRGVQLQLNGGRSGDRLCFPMKSYSSLVWSQWYSSDIPCLLERGQMGAPN